MNRKYLLLCLLLEMSTSSIVLGADFYVSTTGNDSASGSLSAPWKTPNYAMTKVRAGDSVRLIAGTDSVISPCHIPQTSFTRSGVKE